MASWLPEKKDLGSFDSRIDPPAGDSPYFQLTLILRLFFRPLNPPAGKKTAFVKDADNLPVLTRRWTKADWIHFRTEFRYQVYMAWDYAFLLTPPDNYDGFVWPAVKGTRRKVACRIQVNVVDHEEDTHAQISLVQLALDGPHRFRSDDFTLDSSDLLPTPVQGFGFQWEHHTLPHEIGHLLGLGHINQKSAACRQNPGTGVCYGVTLQQRVNVMGGGDGLDLEDAKPWVERMAQVHTHTSVQDWKVDWTSLEAATRGWDNVQPVASKKATP